MSLAQPNIRKSRVHIDETPGVEKIFALKTLDNQALHGPFVPELPEWVRLRSYVRYTAFLSVIGELNGVRDLVPSVSEVIDELNLSYAEGSEDPNDVSSLRDSLRIHDRNRAGSELRSQITSLRDSGSSESEIKKLEERLNSIEGVFSKIDEGLRVIEEKEYDVTKPVVRGMSIASNVEKAIAQQAGISPEKTLAEMSLRFRGFTLAGDHIVGDIADFVSDKEAETVVVNREDPFHLYVEGRRRCEKTVIDSLIYRRELPSQSFDLSQEKAIRLRETGISVSDDDIMAYLKGIYGEDISSAFLNNRLLPKELNGRLPATLYAFLTSQPLINYFRTAHPDKLGFYMSLEMEFYAGIRSIGDGDRLVPYLLQTRRSSTRRGSENARMIRPEIVLVNDGSENSKKNEPIVKVTSVIAIV